MTRGSPSCVFLPPDCETAASCFDDAARLGRGRRIGRCVADCSPCWRFDIGSQGGCRRRGVSCGAEGVLVVSRLLREPQYAFHSLLLGMSLRMGVPLFLGLILYLSGSPLANAEFLVYLGGFYAITLTVGVCLSLPSAS